MDVTQQQRIAENEVRFRRMNETLTETVDGFHGSTGPHQYAIMCECAVTECRDMIDVSPAEYAKIRSDPTWFAIRPGHIVPATESTVERGDRFWIVRKLGTGASVAREAAPK